MAQQPANDASQEILVQKTVNYDNAVKNDADD